MPSPPERSPQRVGRRPAAARKRLSQRERKRQAFLYWVTVFLAVVFIGTSVGALILVRPVGGTNTTSSVNQLQQRLAVEREQARKNPNDPQWPYQMGRLLAESNQLDEAIVQYKDALKRDPGYLPALQDLGNIYLTQNKPKEAQQLLKSGIEAEKNDIAKLNKARKPDEPEALPDPIVRVLLFDADMALGPSFAKEAEKVCREGLASNPVVFMQKLQGWALTTAFQRNKKDETRRGLQIVLAQATSLKDAETVGKVSQLTALMEKLEKSAVTLPSGAPSHDAGGSPAATPSAGAASAAPASSGVPSAEQNR